MKMSMTVAAISAIAAAAGVANAGFTNVNVGSAISADLGGAANGAFTGTPSSEGGMGSMSVVQILNRVYGNGHTVASTVANVSGSIQGTLSFASSGITATRLHDFAGPSASNAGAGMHLGDATGIDQVWRDGTVVSSATAKFAGANQYFSYRYNTGPTVGAPSFYTTVNGFNQTASATFNLIPGGDFRWIRADNANGTGNIQTSRASDNANGADRMITFFISGTGITRPTYMVFFEDRAGGDNDYNDLAVELQVIPLPTGAAMGMAGLGLLAIRRRAAR
jgi:hypothetical protein